MNAGARGLPEHAAGDGPRIQLQREAASLYCRIPFRERARFVYRVIASLWEAGVRTSTRRYPPGLHKHRSIDEMQQVQERWAAQDR